MKEGAIAEPPTPGLFATLAEQQLGVVPGDARRTLRPLVPHAFDRAAARSETQDDFEGVDSDDADLPRTGSVGGARDERPATGTSVSPAEAPRPRTERTFDAATASRQTDQPRGLDAGPPETGGHAAPAREVATFETSAPKRSPVGRPDLAVEQRHVEERLIRAPSSVSPPVREAVVASPTPDAGRNRLVPASGSSRVTPRLPASPPPLLSAQGRMPSEPVIEIHIGRVEVRALMAAAAPAPGPTSRGAAEPDHRLDAYLRSRSRGARS